MGGRGSAGRGWQCSLDFSDGSTRTRDVSLGAAFHPATAAWFREAFGQPTEVQRRAWAVTAQGRDALITAPTGSGKTLAAFLAAIDRLVCDGLQAPLPDAVQVLYVSPLKALSNDVQKNLQAPLAGIRRKLAELGLPDVAIRDGVRTGDTPVVERERMRRTPPHILVTTPESLYILLTSDSGRRMLKRVHSVIVDELHAVAGSKRGAHLALTLERLDALCERPPVRIGLSATVKPITDMAEFLCGARPPATIIDTGHVRQRDLALEMPRSPLAPVMSAEVWTEIYDRLAQFCDTHRTVLIFVNQRRMAERVARHLAERIGEEHVTAHHGSLSREHRLKAETRLKSGQLKALVATSALELGIDIGDIDLVCQLGSPRSLNAFLQRVGRAGHSVRAIPKGRLFPLSLDDLLESAALLAGVARGELDRIRMPEAPLDVLAQQIVAEASSRECTLDALYATVTRAQPYRTLARKDFEAVVQMLSEGYATRRGRRGAWLHYDAVNRVVRARRGARMAGVMNAGTIPDQFDYDVVLVPDETRIGSLNEDFAFESIPGDVFQLGNTAYKIARVETGKVYVEDAKGQSPTIPFWFGEAPSRSDELSTAVSQLNAEANALLDADPESLAPWLLDALGLDDTAASQLATYLASAHAALGTLPTQQTIVFERFFDEVGDTHLVVHSPYGSRINRAWGLSLRKRFCRQFNFELQASALEDSLVLSLGPTHSFPLETVKDFLKSASVRGVLVQALLTAPMFELRWRRTASIALAVQRMRNGKRNPPQFQRADSDDLLTVVFPDQVACAENLAGPREVPDHPLVRQTIDDCLHDTMDIVGLERLLGAIERGEVRVVARDLAAPSPLSHAIVNARPYAFLDDGDAEGRRTRSVDTSRLPDIAEAAQSARLDPQAIARVREEAWPTVGNAEELHDALLTHAFLTQAEVEALGAAGWLAALQAQSRICSARLADGAIWVTAERLAQFQDRFASVRWTPAIAALPRAAGEGEALAEILRGRLECLGPIDEVALAAPLGLTLDEVHAALLQLEAEGAAMRGDYDGSGARQWCDRRLLARVHRYTRERRRAEHRPVPPSQFLRFLFRWHRLAGSGGDAMRQGEAGLLAALAQLEGCVAPAASWESELLAARVQHYAPQQLDRLCTSGRVVWWRPRAAGDEARKRSGPIRSTPILLSPRDTLSHWQHQAAIEPETAALSGRARRVLEVLRAQGASFFSDLQSEAHLLRAEVEDALAELVGAGLVHCDAYAGLRALLMPAERRARLRKRFPGVDAGLDEAGRWSLVRTPRRDGEGAVAEARIEHVARTLLARYGVVFRKLIEREDGLPPWRELHYVYRRLEARGEVSGGRFVSQFAGEQFALPEAAIALRGVAAEMTEGRDPQRSPERVLLAATDPLNLAGVLTPGERLPRVPGNRVLFEDGVPIALHAAGETRYPRELPPQQQWEINTLMIRKQRPERFVDPAPGGAPPQAH